MKRYAFLFATCAVLVLLGAWYVSGPREALQDRNADLALELEYATSSMARGRGLSGRESLAPDRGLLFVFPEPGRHGIWMKDMRFPIDIFWLDRAGRVVSVAEDVATSTYPAIFYPTAPAYYVLETSAGFARTHVIATGTRMLSADVLKNIPTVSE